MHKIQKFKFGERLKEVMKEKGFNAYRLTQLTTLSKNTVSSYLEQPSRNPRLDIMLEIFDALGMSAQDFFGDPPCTF